MKMEFKFTSIKTAIQVANLKINARIRIQYKQLIFVRIYTEFEKFTEFFCQYFCSYP